MIIRLFMVACIMMYNHGYALDGSEQDVLQEAAVAYKENSFEQAEKLLQQIEHKSAVVWYDLGTLFYKKNEYDLALAYWRIASLKGSSKVQQAADFNIHFLKKKMNSVVEESFFKKIKDSYRMIPLGIFQCIFLLCWLSFLFFIKNYKRGTNYKALFCILLLIITTVSGVMLGLKYHINEQHIGIVMKQNSVLFAGPDERYHTIGQLERATEIIIQEKRDSWYKVSTEKGSGWMMRDVIAIV